MAFLKFPWQICVAVAVVANIRTLYCQILEPYSRHLTVDDNYHVNWTVYDETKEIEFHVTVQTNGWIGFGISYNGAMNGADIVVGGIYANGTSYLEDRHGMGNFAPVLDASQDYKLLRASHNATHTTLVFSRLLVTGDLHGDVDITEDTLHLIWAYGTGPDFIYHGAQTRGAVGVNFLDPDVEAPSPAELGAKYNVWRPQKQVHVAANDTVYMCSFFKGPNVTSKHHVVGFSMYIDSTEPAMRRRVHHADLYRCTAPAGQNPDEFFSPHLHGGYDCNFSPVPFPYDHCAQFEYQWTIGGQTTMFPDGMGLPIGRDDGVQEYYMTEVHYDNPERRDDLHILAGFEIYYTPELRRTEVGQLQLGVMTNKTYALTIPPNSTEFVVSSHCPGACTGSLPVDGINVFTYLLHSHLSGKKLKLRHFRGGKELEVLAKDDHFDFKYQNNRRLRRPVKILPNDHLTFECTYDTTWRKGVVTLGGRSARDEMCQAFLLYYPRSPLVNSCGSYHQQGKILAYMGIESVFQTQGEIDATITAPAGLRGTKYGQHVERGMNWTPTKRAEFKELMQYDDQQAYCSPVHYHNESFIQTNYAVALERVTMPTSTVPATAAPHPLVGSGAAFSPQNHQVLVVLVLTVFISVLL